MGGCIYERVMGDAPGESGVCWGKNGTGNLYLWQLVGAMIAKHPRPMFQTIYLRPGSLAWVGSWPCSRRCLFGDRENRRWMYATNPPGEPHHSFKRLPEPTKVRTCVVSIGGSMEWPRQLFYSQGVARAQGQDNAPIR